MYYSDYHLHTEFSGDSNQDIIQLIEHGISLGLKEIAITDHYEHDIEGMTEDFALDVPKYVEKILELKSKYKNQINIKLGLEIGSQLHLREFFYNSLKNYPLDIIIASNHSIDKVDLFFCKIQKGRTKDQVQDIYFENVLRMVEIYDNYSIVGHLDYVTRYGGEEFRGLNYERQKDIIDKILLRIIEKGKGIEINTSGFRYKEDRFYPTKDIVKRYFDLGGEIISIGSDAHKYQDMATYFDKAYNFLKEIGIKYISTFEKLNPVFQKI
ncbi:histidinol-phosphatase HisJ family protein [Fusobacterium sp. PH5-44]|uniref:histidinol-phosphatase HisJ family protein n=1 Tax=unclassified Fusobacterium TaxID=2648384 RepID=UPI003D196041